MSDAYRRPACQRGPSRKPCPPEITSVSPRVRTEKRVASGTDPWVRDGLENIDDGIDDHIGGADHERHAGDRREIGNRVTYCAA